MLVFRALRPRVKALILIPCDPRISLKFQRYRDRDCCFLPPGIIVQAVNIRWAILPPHQAAAM
jgi:hypothetical protein